MGNKIVRSQEWVGLGSLTEAQALTAESLEWRDLRPDFGRSAFGLRSCRFGPEWESGEDFRKNINAVDARAHTDPAVAIFEAHD